MRQRLKRVETDSWRLVFSKRSILPPLGEAVMIRWSWVFNRGKFYPFRIDSKTKFLWERLEWRGIGRVFQQTAAIFIFPDRSLLFRYRMDFRHFCLSHDLSFYRF